MRNLVVLITGANNGIGFAMTQALLKDDYSVAALDISVDNLNTLKTSFPERLLVFHCDVSVREQVEKSL